MISVDQFIDLKELKKKRDSLAHESILWRDIETFGAHVCLPEPEIDSEELYLGKTISNPSSLHFRKMWVVGHAR